MQKILIVSHCLLNTASKVERFKEESVRSEEQLRREVLREAVDSGVQLLQLPCPEFVMYGSLRWGIPMSSLTIPSIEAGAGSFWSRWCSSLRNIWQIKNGSGFWGFWELMAAPAAESGIPAGASGAENLEEEIWSRF